MIKKIIHVSICSNNEVLNRALLVDECLEAGLEVFFYDLSVLTGAIPSINGNFVNTRICSIEDLREKLNAAGDNVLLNIQIYYEHRWHKIFEVIRSQKKVTSFFSFSTTPMPAISIQRISKLKLSEIIAKCYYKLLTSNNYYYPNYVFSAGRKAAGPYEKKSRIVKINSYDYISSMESIEDIPIHSPFAVFIDQLIPSHPDRRLADYQCNQSDSDFYYENIKNFFNEFEKNNNINVVIAAHPKSKYPNNFFGNRPIFKGNSKALIAHSKIVITHFSTAISFAVIYKKPIIFLSSNKLKSLNFDRFVRAFSIYFKSEVHMLGEDINIGVLPVVNGDIYNAYMNDFITWEKKSDILSPNQVVNFIKNIR